MPTKRLRYFAEEKKDDDDMRMMAEEQMERESLLVPSGDKRYADPLRQTEPPISTRRSKRNHAAHHDPVVGVSFSMQSVALITLVLLIASQTFLFHCCRISVHNRNETLERQRTRREYKDPTYHETSTVPLLRKYSMNIKSATIWSSASDSASDIATIYPDDTIVVEERMTATSKFEGEEHLHVLRPFLGYLDQRRRNKPLQRNGTDVHPWIFEPLPEEDQPNTAEFSTKSMCPLLYSAWSTSSTSKYMYANPALVVSQQFWNGMQVFVLLLVVLVNFKFTIEAREATAAEAEMSKKAPISSTASSSNRMYRILPLALLPMTFFLSGSAGSGLVMMVAFVALAMYLWTTISDRRSADQAQNAASFIGCISRIRHATTIALQTVSTPQFKMWSVRCISLATVIILPFSSYVSSPGGHIFALVAGGWIALAMLSQKLNLRLSLGESQAIMAEMTNPRFSAPVTICFEETLGFFCTLGSSMYNFAGHTYVWPHWKHQFKRIDRYMGWPSSGDLTWEENWTIWGLFDESGVLPPFVPRGNGGSTAGAQMFWLDWSVLPFLYCCYYACMIILSQKTPSRFSRWFQRIACSFGILHFLFGTDVVHYRYGRGYRNPHSELFHWTEKWSWRVAILVPIWQNCVSGHWKHGHRYKLVSGLVHYAMMFWGIGFLIFQVLQADVVNTYQFAYGLKKKGMIQYLGWGEESQLWFELEYPYMRALVQMWVFYALLHVTGFALFSIYLQKENAPAMDELNRGTNQLNTAAGSDESMNEKGKQALEQEAAQVVRV